MNRANPVLKTDLEENWNKATNFIPKNNEIIVYECENGTMRLKIGNGKTKVNDLPFLTPAAPTVNDNILKL